MASLLAAPIALPPSPGEQKEIPSERNATSDSSTMSGDATLSIADREPKLLGAGMRVLIQTNKRNQSGAVSSFIGKGIQSVYLKLSHSGAKSFV